MFPVTTSEVEKVMNLRPLRTAASVVLSAAGRNTQHVGLGVVEGLGGDRAPFGLGLADSREQCVRSSTVLRFRGSPVTKLLGQRKT
jgi:hypothetical protein